MHSLLPNSSQFPRARGPSGGLLCLPPHSTQMPHSASFRPVWGRQQPSVADGLCLDFLPTMGESPLPLLHQMGLAVTLEESVRGIGGRNRLNALSGSHSFRFLRRIELSAFHKNLLRRLGNLEVRRALMFYSKPGYVMGLNSQFPQWKEVSG